MEYAFQTIEALENDGDERKNLPKLPFSDIFRHWIISENIPREAAMRFIKTLQYEDAVYDVPTMPASWVTLTGLNSAKVNQIAPIQRKTDNNGLVVCEYIYFGLRTPISDRLEGILWAAYPDGDFPACPHLFIELWMDGVSVAKRGRLDQLWPVEASVVGVATRYTERHRIVPGYASVPFIVAHHLADSKPANAAILLRDAVDELLRLDPRDNDNAGNIAKAGFSVSLRMFAGDTPTQAMAKGVYGHTSQRPCFKCRVHGIIIQGMHRGIQILEVACKCLRVDQSFLAYTHHVIFQEVQSVSPHAHCAHMSQPHVEGTFTVALH
jgi:hypothetical protein